MVALLIVLYLIIACCATVFAMWEDRLDYALDSTHLILVFILWPIFLAGRALDLIEWKHIRNPFWKRGTP